VPKDTLRTATTDHAWLQLAEQVTVAVAELAGAAREGLLALAFGTGLRVLKAVLAEDVARLDGPKARHNPDWTAVHHGSEPAQMTLGGRRVRVRRPRVRAPTAAANCRCRHTRGSPRPVAGPARGGADARQAVHPPQPGRAGTGRRRGRARGGWYIQVGGLAPIRRRDRACLAALLAQDLSGLDLVPLLVEVARRRGPPRSAFRRSGCRIRPSGGSHLAEGEARGSASR
jgi:hypothetical protein